MGLEPSPGSRSGLRDSEGERLGQNSRRHLQRGESGKGVGAGGGKSGDGWRQG